MQLTLKAGDLAAALKICHPAVPGKTTLPILTHVMLDARHGRLTISATNLEISLRTSVPAEVSTDGRTTVPEAKLATWCSFQHRDTDVTLKGDDKNITLQAGRDRAKLPAISAEDYPPIPEHDAEPINISAALLDQALDRTLGNVAKEDSRPVLFGALLTFDGETLEMVGADGFTLGLARVDLAAPVAERTTLIVPGRSLAALQSLLGDVGLVEIKAGTHGVSFDVGPTTLSSRIIEGQFPDYRRIIPTEAKSTTVVNTAALIAQVQAAQMVDRATPVRFRPDPEAGTLTIWARDADVEHEGVLDAEVSGEPLEVALRGDQALLALRALGSETVELRLNGPASPVLLTAPGGEATAIQICMPTYVDDKNRAIRSEAA